MKAVTRTDLRLCGCARVRRRGQARRRRRRGADSGARGRRRPRGMASDDWPAVPGQDHGLRAAQTEEPDPGDGFRWHRRGGRQGCQEFRIGDEVFGTCAGSFAEYACARADRVAPKPANLTLEQAAVLPTSGCTALQGLRDVGRLQAGQSVLILGAVGWRGHVRGATCEGVRSRGHRSVPDRRDRTGPIPRRGPRDRLHPRGLRRWGTPLRPDPRHRGPALADPAPSGPQPHAARS